MRVLIAFLFAIASAAAAGSGPYLPSGWKPDGPAFFLPSEVQKPADNPLKETLFQETEASGSDALREYGPPKLDQSPLQVSNQGLPDVITEQTFFVVEAKSEQDAVESIVVEGTSGVEVNAEQTSANLETVTATATKEEVSEDNVKVSDDSTSQIKIEVQPTIEGSVLEVQPTIDGNTLEVKPTIDGSTLEVLPTIEGSVLEVQTTIDTGISEVEPTIGNIVLEVQPALDAGVLEIDPSPEGRALNIEQYEVESTEIATTEKVEELVLAVEEAVKENVAAGVKNIADALEQLEKEIKAVEVQANEEVTEAKVTQETSGSLEQAPVGFLEYGPPGFREYGPPKEEDLLRSALVQVASTDTFDNNEVRRRRFSPKFKSPKKAH